MIRTPLSLLAAGALGLVLAAPHLSAQTSAADRAAFERETDALRRAQPKQYQQMRDGFTLLTEMLLGRLGYDVGPFDGVLDNRTKSGIREYQKAHNIPETGDPFTFDTVQAVSPRQYCPQDKPV